MAWTVYKDPGQCQHQEPLLQHRGWWACPNSWCFCPLCHVTPAEGKKVEAEKEDSGESRDDMGFDLLNVYLFCNTFNKRLKLAKKKTKKKKKKNQPKTLVRMCEIYGCKISLNFFKCKLDLNHKRIKLQNKSQMWIIKYWHFEYSLKTYHKNNVQYINKKLYHVTKGREQNKNYKQQT